MNAGRNLGYAQAFAAYSLWGVFPIYWKQIKNVASVEVICHRIVWSLLTLLVLVTFLRQWPSIKEALQQPKRIALSALAAVLVTINWLAFIWSVNNNYILESSLGYFINPLLTVLLAVVLFRERISTLQWTAIGLAFFGVAIMTLETGRFPWIAFFLATSFASYAAAKKKTTLPSIAGLGMETAVLTPVALIMIFVFQWHYESAIDRTPTTWSLLALGGPVTTLPLVLFAAAAKSVPMVAMGMLQYVGPTLQFMIATFIYQEPVTAGKLVGFAFVWIALAVFTWGTIAIERQRKQRLAFAVE